MSFLVTKGQKIAIVGSNEQAQTALFRILAEEIEPDSGSAIEKNILILLAPSMRADSNSESGSVDWKNERVTMILYTLTLPSTISVYALLSRPTFFTIR